MPRLRNPSLKIRENLELTVPGSSTRASKTVTPSRTATPPLTKIPATNKSNTSKAPTGKKRRGRAKATNAGRKSGARSKKNKVKKEEEYEDFGYEYDSHSSSSSSDNDEDFIVKPEPIDYVDDEEPEDIHPTTKDDHFYDDNNEIFCPWADSELNVPPLILPESSADIPTVKEYIMDLIEIYEVLRSFSRTLKLTPFIFEDFCAAMSSPENSCILSEIHICLLKACLRSDDEEQVHYSANDTNNAVNITFYALDSMTYAEVLRLYLESDRAKGRVPEEILAAINTPNYPFVGIEIRASVITYLCYRFLDLNDFKKIVTASGSFMNEEICRNCMKGGDLLNCAYCELSFHSYCHDLQEKPDPFICGLCKMNDVKGVTGCEPLDQTTNRQPLRMTPIGRDRHGRIYWFVARRIIIQDELESTLIYYSTAPQLYELVSVLDPNYYEYSLCQTISKRINEILDQMATTLELTSERHDIIKTEQHAKMRITASEAFLHIDNVLKTSKILTDLKERTNDVKKEDLSESLPGKMLPMLGIGSEGNLLNSFWAGNLDEEKVLICETKPIIDINLLFALGHPKFDDQFKKYKNNYPTHEHGESLTIRKKANDKKKYMATRFSLIDEGDDAFRWSTAKGKDMYGPERQHAKYLEWTIAKLHKKIPVEMMHRRWPEVADGWKEDLSKSESFDSLSDCLLRFEACMRRTLFLGQFWSSLGLTRWTRTTVEDREISSKENQRKKKDEKDASSPDFDDADFIRVKYTRLPGKSCPQTLWRMRDETYRLGGKVLGGWIWISSTLVRKWVPLPEKPPLGYINMHETSIEAQKPAARKARRLESFVQKLTSWRQSEVKLQIKNDTKPCYSPGCQRAFSGNPVCEGYSTVQSCYSFDCRMWDHALSQYLSSEDSPSTSGIAKARNICDFPTENITRGEGNSKWPLLLPTSFTSRKTGKKSILVIPDVIYKKLARTAGRVQMYIPNFSLSAKSNFSLWNYPCPRPCFDLCWKWLTTNANSLHAVSLQLKILWFCIKWSEFFPGDDETEDGRLIVHQPDCDEIRHVIAHKEFPPQGTYERYHLKIEGVMLDEDEPDDDYEHRGSSTRKKDKKANLRPKRSISRQTRKTTRQEWIDGIELKVFEIRAYWESISAAEAKKASRVIFSKDYISTRDVYCVNNRLPLSQPISTPNTGYYHGQPLKRRVVPPRRDDNFAYDDKEFDTMEQGVYNTREPAVKRAKVILQPEQSAGYVNKPSYSYTPAPTAGSSTKPMSNGITFRSNGRHTEATSTNVSRNHHMPAIMQRSRVAAGGNEGGTAHIARYNSPSLLSQSPSTLPGNSGPRPVAYSQRVGTPQANGKVLLLRRSDGSTQYLRAVTPSRSETIVSPSNAYENGQQIRKIATPVGDRPATYVRTITVPTKIVKIGPNGERYEQTLAPGTRIVSRQPSSNMQSHPSMVKSASYNSYYGQSPSNDPSSMRTVYSQPGYSQSRLPQQIAGRGGSTMAAGQRIVQLSSIQPATNVAQPFNQTPTSSSQDMDFDENFLEPPPAPSTPSENHSVEINNNPA